MENDIWLKRWNTIKNLLDEMENNPDHDDCCYGTIRTIKAAMETIETFKD